jgi:hypothetical protein
MQPIEPTTGYDIFISHSHQDGKLVGEVRSYLESRGLRCWVSSRVEDNPGGTRFKAEIARQIAEIPIFILVLTKNANASDDVASETSIAYENKKYIIAFNPFKIKFSGSFSYDLIGKNHVQGGKDNFSVQLERLYKSCITYLNRMAQPLPRQSVWAVVINGLKKPVVKRAMAAILVLVAGIGIWAITANTKALPLSPSKNDSLFVSGIVRPFNDDKGIAHAWITSDLTPGDTIIATSDGTFELTVKAEPGQSIRIYAGAPGYKVRDEYHTLPKAINMQLRKL